MRIENSILHNRHANKCYLTCLMHSSALMTAPKTQLACMSMPMWDYYFPLAYMLVAS